MTVNEQETWQELNERFPEMDEGAKLRAAADVAKGAVIEEAVAVEAVLRDVQRLYNR